MKITRYILSNLSKNLPARDIRHEGRPYLRRYYLCTLLGIRFYLHHFVDSDPDGLHNHPWRYGGSILLSDYYYEERRFCYMPFARRIRWFNIVNGDTLHRVIVPTKLLGSAFGVWTIFWHTKLVSTWGTIKNKGAFTQYVEHYPNNPREDGHSAWWKSAPKGRELFAADEQ